MTTWHPAPARPALVSTEVHLWAIPLQVEAAERATLVDLLDEDERARAARYLHAPTREQFIIARARLRQVLGRHLELEPSKITFVLTSTGKPRVNLSGWHFNLSHTQGLALIAVTSTTEVGIDVERVRPYPTHLELAQRYFTPAESAALARLPEAVRERAFFQLWTRKEAFLKAIGLGLAHGLERFEVSVHPEEPATLLHIDGDPTAAREWTLVSLTHGQDHVGTLAVPKNNVQVRHWQWTGD